MNKHITLTIIAIVLGIGLFVGGVFFGRANAHSTLNSNMAGMMHGNMAGMMNGDMAGMMNGDMAGMMNGDMAGMMNGDMAGMMGHMMGNAQQHAQHHPDSQTAVEPLTLEETTTALADYLAGLNLPGLAPGEVLLFDNHAYAQILDTAAGQGAFQVLVDYASRTVMPEHGPTMMWNTEYGMLSSAPRAEAVLGGMMGGMMHGMMGGYGPGAEVRYSAAEAVELARNYLAANQPGVAVGDSADTFPGYYTLHTLQDGAIVGLVSVNAYSGQVFPHHWHGAFIAMGDAAN